MPTITSATASFTLSVAQVFPTPVTLQGFGPDDAFDIEDVDTAETMVGVDGTGVAGWIPRQVTQTITFLASSPSCDIFDQWLQAMDTISDILYATGLIRIPAIGKQYSMPLGTLRRYKTAPDAKRVLQPRRYNIVWLPQPFAPAVIVSPI